MLVVLSAGILAVPFCGQILVHWLSVDALKSSTDPLTGLRNRRGFYRSASKLFAAETRTLCLSVVMLDLDNFKRINDTHGHATGDRILVAIADTLRRIGGAETVIARSAERNSSSPSATGLGKHFETAEAIRLAIAATPWGVTASLSITASDCRRNIKISTGGSSNASSKSPTPRCTKRNTLAATRLAMSTSAPRRR